MSTSPKESRGEAFRGTCSSMQDRCGGVRQALILVLAIPCLTPCLGTQVSWLYICASAYSFLYRRSIESLHLFQPTQG